MKTVYTLSGGAAYGYAHIGVLKYLEEYNIRPAAIAGTSMGAIVGGFYAYGYDAEHIREIAEHIRSLELVRLFFPSFPRGGIIDTDGIRDFMYGFIQDARIEDLPVVFRSVAVDINTSEEIVFDRGRLIDAIMASMSIPAVFKPYYYRGRYLVDGGLLNNLPWDIAQTMGDVNIVIDVAPKVKRPDPVRICTSEIIQADSGSDPAKGAGVPSAVRHENRLKNEAFRIQLKKLIQAIQNKEDTVSMRDLVNSFTKSSGNRKESQSIPEIITLVMAIVDEYIRRPPERTPIKTIYLHVDLMGYSLNDFHKADEIINAGYRTAAENTAFINALRSIKNPAGRSRIV